MMRLLPFLQPSDCVGDRPIGVVLGPVREIFVRPRRAPVQAANEHNHPADIGGLNDPAKPRGMGRIKRGIRPVALHVGEGTPRLEIQSGAATVGKHYAPGCDGNVAMRIDGNVVTGGISQKAVAQRAVARTHEVRVLEGHQGQARAKEFGRQQHREGCGRPDRGAPSCRCQNPNRISILATRFSLSLVTVE